MQLRRKSTKFTTLAFRLDTAASLVHRSLFVHITPYVHKLKRFLTFEMRFCTINPCPQHHDAAVPLALQNCAISTKNCALSTKNCALSTKKLCIETKNCALSTKNCAWRLKTVHSAPKKLQIVTKNCAFSAKKTANGYKKLCIQR